MTNKFSSLKICPLEVKAGINPKSKSLKSYDLQFRPTRLMRTNLLNLKKDGKICNLPLYGVSLLPRFISGDVVFLIARVCIPTLERGNEKKDKRSSLLPSTFYLLPSTYQPYLQKIKRGLHNILRRKSEFFQNCPAGCGCTER